MRGFLAGVVLVALIAVPMVAQSGASASGERPHVVRLSHFIHATTKLEPTIAFYRDVFGLTIPEPRQFASQGAAILNNAPNLSLRLSMARFSEGFGFELTEFSNVERKTGIQGLPTDPGAVMLILPVRSIDQVLANAKKANAEILSRSNGTPGPVQIPSGSGTTRALMLRDVDGYLVRAVVGMDLQGDMKFQRVKGMADLHGAPADSQVRTMATTFPDTKARMEFLEWKGMKRTPFQMNVPDPGAGGWVGYVSDLDGMFKKMKEHKVRTVTPEPVWFSKTTLDIFIFDPDGLHLELAQTVPQPATPKPSN